MAGWGSLGEISLWMPESYTFRALSPGCSCVKCQTDVWCLHTRRTRGVLPLVIQQALIMPTGLARGNNCGNEEHGCLDNSLSCDVCTSVSAQEFVWELQAWSLPCAGVCVCVCVCVWALGAYQLWGCWRGNRSGLSLLTGLEGRREVMQEEEVGGGLLMSALREDSVYVISLRVLIHIDSLVWKFLHCG